MANRRSRLALAAGAALVGYAGLHDKLRRYEIAESSMEPELEPGDYVIARSRGELVRGDIVIIPHPAVAKFELVKRVIGLPGETVTLDNGQVHIDDKVLAEPWADGPVGSAGRWELGAGHVFVLGDNRAVSASDSRTIGPVPVATIEWKVVARYWPLGAIGSFTG